MATLVTLSDVDHETLRAAHRVLEHPSFAARASQVLGTPIQGVLGMLPPQWARQLRRGAESAVSNALDAAISSLERAPARRARTGVHQAMAVGSGAVGGMFGLTGLLLEVPVTTVVMLRAIADVARSHGEDLGALETRLACLEVFAFGGRSHAGAYTEVGYYEIRTMLAFHFSVVAEHVAASGAAARTLPSTVLAIRAIAARFGVVISEKAAFQMVPVLGAAAGGAINALFMRHFLDVADAHFTIRDLERKHGFAAVERAYAAISEAETRAAAA